MRIRPAAEEDVEAIFTIINDGARAYRGVIPADRWHEPYMPMEHLRDEMRAGVAFWIAEDAGEVAGVMGIQDKGAVSLVRHAYVSTRRQRGGVGTQLLRHVTASATKPILIGTWAAATWAIDFYCRNGFTLLPNDEKERLLRRFWSIPERQIETSVVLADGQWMAAPRGS